MQVGMELVNVYLCAPGGGIAAGFQTVARLWCLTVSLLKDARTFCALWFLSYLLCAANSKRLLTCLVTLDKSVLLMS